MALNYLGKKKRGSDATIANRLKVSVDDIIGLKQNTIRYLTNEKTGDVTKVDIANSPLLLREFGVKRINNKLITGGLIKKGFVVSKDAIQLNKVITGKIIALFEMTWISSGHKWKKEVYMNVNKKILKNEENVERMMTNLLFELYQDIENGFAAGEIDIQLINLSFKTTNNISLDFNDVLLRGVPLDITKVYGETVDLNISTDNNCVKNHLFKKYPKIKSTSQLNDDGITPNQLKEFCERYSIKMIIFDINQNIMCQHIPEKINKSYSNLIGIAYNNHFYPLKNKELHRIKIDVKHYIYMEKLDKKLIEILKDGDFPNNVSIHQDELTSIQIGDTVYHTNEDYTMCLNILTILGIPDKMTFLINRQNIANTISKLFIKSSVDSYFPYNSNECGYSFLNMDFDDEEATVTIDHNKHYSDALRKLSHLITIDIKTAIHIHNPKELKEGFFYIAKPKLSNILMLRTGFYSYDFLKYCEKENVEFQLIEAISCEQKENYYTDMINTLYSKLSSDDFKFVMNCMIGGFELKPLIQHKNKFIKIANKDETKTCDKYVRELNKNYNIIFDIEETVNLKILNKVPIRVQVLCEARKIVYEKIKELGLKRDDIKQIRTDAITFKYDGKLKCGKGIGEWKQQSSTPFKTVSEIQDIDLTFVKQSINKNNTIFVDYAGSGKTHHIINKLIPTLEDYIVVSPSHASIREYRQKNINCNVIQKYILGNILPTEKNIIVDEVGMLDAFSNNVLIKCALMGKTIYSFGDFKQLKPVNGEPCNSPIYLNYLYGSINKLGTNFRNDFTFDYYDKLCKIVDAKEIQKEIEKYNCKSPYDADVIITYTNATKEKYNKMMCDKLKIKMGDVGCRIVCKSNDLKDKNIYNNFYYNIKSVDENKITITDGLDDIIIDDEELKLFDLGYCRTLYNIQGESVKSFYFPIEDVRFINGRALYTLISRLKTK